MKQRISKTYVTAALAILTAWGAWLAGEATAMQALQGSMTALMACFVRAAVVRNGVDISRLPAVLLMLGLAGLSMGGLTSCAGSGPVTFGYGLPHDAGRVDVTLFPDRLRGGGKIVVPAK